MELRHLEYFVAVADARNFTRAAEQLHVVQSGVSAAVKARDIVSRSRISPTKMQSASSRIAARKPA